MQRPKQQLPSEILADLMSAIRSSFYPDSLGQDKAAFKRWSQDQRFLHTRVVLWPASWLNKRGVTLKPERYKQIIMGVLNEVKTHGKTEAVKFWPGYLAHCIQQHFKHNSEAIYEEGKNLRAQLEQALSTAGAARSQGPDPITVMAEARRDLLLSARGKTGKKSTRQLPLL